MKRQITHTLNFCVIGIRRMAFPRVIERFETFNTLENVILRLLFIFGKAQMEVFNPFTFLRIAIDIWKGADECL